MVALVTLYFAGGITIARFDCHLLFEGLYVFAGCLYFWYLLGVDMCLFLSFNG